MLDGVVSGFYGFLHALHYHHPIHPTQVHLPVGLVAGGFVLSLLGSTRRRPEFSRAAWYCMNLALVSMLPTIATGLMDWRHSYAGVVTAPFEAKFLLAAFLLALLSTGFLIGRRSRGEKEGMVLLYALCLLTVTGLGYFGGELVYAGRLPAPAQTFQAGQTLYEANCAGCHRNGGNSMNPKLPVKNSPKTSDLRTFVAWLRAPQRPMPAFPEAALSEAEAKDLFEYVANVVNKS